MAETVETAVYRLRVEGQDQVDRATRSVEGLATAEDKLASANRTTSAQIQRGIAAYDPLIRAQEKYLAAMKQIENAREKGTASESQLAARLALEKKAYDDAAVAAEHYRRQQANAQATPFKSAQDSASVFDEVGARKMQTALTGVATATKLSRYELINLSRQAQDVGVSLFSGQGFFTVLVQQGSQIFDVFASSKATVGSFFTSAIEWAGKFLTPMNVAIGAVVTFGAAAVTAAAQWSSAQKDIEQSLLGIGARSGATASSINQFAEGGGLTGLSTAERRNVGTEFAKTGDLDASKINGITEAVQGYAIKTGTTATEATKALAKALSGDLAKGIQDLGKVYGTLNPILEQTVANLLKQGDRAKAVQAIINALDAETRRSLDTMGPLAKGWEMVGNAASYAADMLAKVIFAQGKAGQERQARRGSAAEAAGMGMRDDLIAAKGQTAIDSVIPQIKQIRDLEQALADLERAKQGVGASGPIPPIVDPGAEQAIKNQLQALKESQAEAARYNQRVAEIAASWQGVGQAVALQLQQLQNELPVLQAITGQQRMAAQAAADYANAIDAGKTELEASALAAAKLEAAQASATTSVKQQVESLKDSTEMIKAQQNGTEATTAASIAYKNAIRDGASATSAAALAAATLENKMAGAANYAAQYRDNLMGAAEDRSGAGQYFNFPGSFSQGPGSVFAPTTMTGQYTTDAVPGTHAFDILPTSVKMAYAQQASDQGYADKAARNKAVQDKLTTSIDKLTKSTDSLNSTNQELLSPFYTQDPRTSHIGFRSQGMAAGGYVDVPGGVSSNDNMIATIPVASGERIYIDPMANRRGSSGGGGMVVNISSPINIYGNADKDQFGRTVYQANQQLAKQVRTATQ